MARYSVGIYWDNVSLSACLVKVGATEHTVERIITMPREYDETYTPRKHLSEELFELLKDAFTEPMDTFVMSLPERETMHRSLARPFGDRRKISLTIAPEVETLLPVVDGDIIVDYVLLGKDEAGLHQIETVSATHKAVKKLITEAIAAGIDPEIVDAPPAALLAGARNVFRLKDETTYLFLHMGWQETSLAVLTGRAVRHIGSFPYGFEKIALAAFKGRAIAPDELKDTLRQGVSAGSLLDPCIREVLIKLSRMGSGDHDHVLVATGYARFIRDLPDKFRESADISSELPETGSMQRGVETGELLENFMSVSLGLRGIDSTDSVNFRKKDLVYAKKIEWIKGYTGTWTKIAAVFVALWLVGLGLNISLNARVNHQLTKLIQKEFGSVMAPGTPMEDPVKQMEQQLARLSPRAGRGSANGGATPLEILRDISLNIPKSIDVLVDSITIEEDNITITGSTSSYDNVEKMKTGLSSLPYAGEVKIVSANVDKNDQRIRLKLVCSKKSNS
jgi:hypothetical protein